MRKNEMHYPRPKRGRLYTILAIVGTGAGVLTAVGVWVIHKNQKNSQIKEEAET